MAQSIDEVRYTVQVHEEDGGLWATVLEMPGVFVSGDSLDEIKEALTEAMGLYLTSRHVTVQFHDLKLMGPVEDGDHNTKRYEVCGV